jgi:hypothetical protein
MRAHKKKEALEKEVFYEVTDEEVVLKTGNLM